MVAQFVDSQFALQHRHFVANHPQGDFLIVIRDRQAIGRLYLDRSQPLWLVIDIALLPDARNSSIGTTLLRWVQRGARRAGSDGVELHVLHTNDRAARLYARLGFVEAPSTIPTHRRMVWRSR